MSAYRLPHHGCACFLTLAACGAAWGQDLMQAWVARTRQVDSLHICGRLRMHRVPPDQDAGEPRNWRETDFPYVEFELWLRRPAFRINLLRTYHDGRLFDRSECAWLDGKLFVYGHGNPEHGTGDGGAIQGEHKSGQLGTIPYLTPLEFDFFDWPDPDVPPLLAKLPYEIEGNTITIKMNPAGTWLARLEVDPAAAYCPRRMTLAIKLGDKPERITWDLAVLETRNVAGLPVISKARIVLWDPHSTSMLELGRLVYLWEATTIEKVPITRADLEIVWPPGTPVGDYINYEQWVVGEAGSRENLEKIDRALLHEMAESIRATNLSPEIWARRRAALIWIIASAAAMTLLVGILVYRMRRLRQSSR